VDVVGLGENVGETVGENVGQAGRNSAPVGATYVAGLASRLTGVAPLAVFFDAVGTSGIVQPPLSGGRREYADYLYTLSFGDTSAGTWAISGKSKNAAFGHVAGHVFETPGTYRVTLNVSDGASVSNDYYVDITVTDPDTVYSGASTICFSNTSDFTGAPSGSTQVTTSSFNTAMGYAASNIRLLFKRGDTFTNTSQNSLSSISGLYIGAFGTGTTPDDRGIYSNNPSIDCSGTSNVFVPTNVTDWRMEHLEFTDTTSTGAGVVGNANTGNSLHTFNKLKITGFNASIGSYHYNNNGNDQFTYHCLDIYQGRTYCIFTGSERLSIMGCRLRDSQTSHVCRVWQAYKGVIQHNEHSGACAANSNGRHALKLHGPSEALIASTGGDHLDHRTQYVIVSDLLIGDSGPWPLAIGPQDSINAENLQDILVENNRIYPGYGTQSTSADVQWTIELNARYATIRNNILTSDGSSSGVFHGVHIWNRGIEWTPLGNRVLNNTFYAPTTKASGAYAVYTDASTDQTTITNNLIQGAGGTYGVVSDNGTNTTTTTNLATLTAGFVDPTNATYTLKDFSLSAGSSAIDYGTTIAVFVDFDGTSRTGTYEAGAFNY